MKTIKATSQMNVPRWSNAAAYLKELENKYQLTIHVIEQKKRWFTLSIWFDVAGEELKVRELMDEVHHGVQRFNMDRCFPKV